MSLSKVSTLRNNFSASFSFRTEQKEGLMFYHQDQVGRASTLFLLLSSCFSRSVSLRSIFLMFFIFACAQDGVCQVLLLDGHVVVRAGNSQIKTLKTYNDDNSHYVSMYNDING